jgi:hypothetical protein
MPRKIPYSIARGPTPALLRKTPLTFDVVRTIGKGMPDVETGKAYGSPAIKLRGKLLACMASHRSAEPHTLVVVVDFLTRDLLIAKDPAVYYVKPHYVPYPCVLVRLERTELHDLKEVLDMGWRYVSTKAKHRKGRAAVSRTSTPRIPKRPTTSGKTCPAMRPCLRP